jgi:hypothetical protein
MNPPEQELKKLVEGIFKRHREIEEAFRAKLEVQCSCGKQLATDYVYELTKPFCGICLKDIPNRKELTVDSLGSLNLTPERMQEKLELHSEGNLLIDSIDLAF